MESQVVSINRSGNFTLVQAKQILPVVRKITEEYRDKVESLLSRLSTIDIDNFKLIDELEAQVNELLSEWNSKISRLGGIPKGLWLVDFDSGDGLFCWKHPEQEICYWHAYSEGLTGRIPIEDKLFVETSLPN